MSKKFQLLIIIIITILPYSNIFQNQFVIDDQSFITNWEVIRNFSNLPKLLAGAVPGGHEGVYRPIRSVFYAVYYQIWGTNPIGWHVHSIVVHLLSTVLVYLILSHLSRLRNLGNLLPFFAALLFGLHPIHTETITYITSSMDAIGIVFFFAAFYLYLLKRKWWSILFAGLAFFTNEITLTLPILLIFYELCFKKSFRKTIPYFIPASFFVFIRFFLIHATSRGPYLANSFYLTMLTMTKVFIKYLSLMFLPVSQANNHAISKGIEAFVYRDYRTQAILAQSIFDLDIIIFITFIIIITIIMIIARKRAPLITFGVGWFFIALLPVSEIIPQGSMLNERMLYIPSFGFILIITRLGGLRYLRYLVLILALSYGYLTYQRNFDWKDEITLWSKDIQAYPNENAYAYYQLGNAYLKAGEADKAIKPYLRSFEINPKFVLGLGTVASLYAGQNKPDEAISTLKQATLANPNFWEGRFNLGNIYLKIGKTDLAANEYKEVLKINPYFLPAQNNLNLILSKTKP